MRARNALAAAVIVVTALVTLGGCQKKSEGGGSGQDEIVLGFSQIGAESEWRTANTNSIKTAAAEAGITLKFSDAQQKQENQIKALRSFIAQRVDVIAFSPVVETGWETVLREAKAVLAERYGITHATIQIEAEGCADADCGPGEARSSAK